MPEILRDDALPPLVGLILAGGRSKRFMGRDKACQMLAGRPLLARAYERAKTQTGDVLISTFSGALPIAGIDAPVIADDMSRHEGPLAGLAAAMAWLAERRPEIQWIATFPVDVPFFPDDLVARLGAASVPGNIPSIAVSGGRAHPVFGLWPRHIEAALRDYLGEAKRNRLVDFVHSQNGVEVNFADADPDPFFNINTAEDLAKAETLIAGMS
jgi:molybdopterin-guanine dinucleotide biosynthesis protein A